jgi:hypothetical protein
MHKVQVYCILVLLVVVVLNTVFGFGSFLNLGENLGRNAQSQEALRLRNLSLSTGC